MSEAERRKRLRTALQDILRLVENDGDTKELRESIAKVASSALTPKQVHGLEPTGRWDPAWRTSCGLKVEQAYPHFRYITEKGESTTHNGALVTCDACWEAIETWKMR